MATACRTRVWLWRWRRNPLRRRGDVIEAWIVLAAWILAVLGGLVAGLVTAGAVERGLDRQREERRPVSAVLTQDAPAKVPTRVVTDQRVWATVRWTTPDGSERTDQTRVPPKTKAGTRITVWTDGHGRLTTKPPSLVEGVLQSAMTGALAAAGTGGLVGGSAWIVRACLDRRRMEQWATEWASIDTRRGWKTG
ncbi:hypothetical protein [Streptomyces sp. NPDC001530]|uniref:Rv1733c family protein n=1 Tax=Streptomyces sp. NPDC001530 TaxID=3364582 RepID=UPI0036B15FDD